ncbi:MAG: PAS domain S-box protein [bacterium]|nr:PAS domain S-box protein [bacterium]
MTEKTKEELIEEIKLLQKRIAELEISDVRRKQAEERATRDKKEWQRTFDLVPDLIALIDREYRIIRINWAMAARLGSVPSQMTGRYCYEVMHGLSAPPDFCPHTRMLKSEKEEYAEFKEKHLDGFFEARINPLRDETGQIIGSVHVARDITEQKRAEERYRKLFNNASDGIFFLNLSGKIIAVNDSFARMHGYNKEEILNMELNELDTPETIKTFPERIQRILKGETLQFEAEHYHKDGHIFPLEVVTNLVEIGFEKLVVAFHRDITERKKMEEEMRKRLQELEIFYKASVCREERILELKKEIEMFKKELNEKR